MVAISSLCVFCGSSTPPDPRYRAAARALGVLAATRGIGLIYGGGRVGLMGELADAALRAGGRVTGVIPTGLFSREVPHTGLTEMHEVATMHARKQLMYDLADGFVALPGGLGTLDELAEVTTWSQLGLHAKPVVLLDVDGFWDPLAAQLDRMVDVGLLKPANRALIKRAASPEGAMSALAVAMPERVEKWISPGDR
ncbi:MAG TPA: TIGR00730 family Rossman fold protein [Streptosporangiaceae bacterium]